MYQEYTLKKHLSELCKENPQYKDLESILLIEEKELKKTLAFIIYNYPHYSMHDDSHSETILSGIELFMGEENIRKLQPTETWLLIMSAYYHDIGMNIPYEIIERELFNKDFQNYLENSIEKDCDKDTIRNKNELLEIMKCLKNGKKYEKYSEKTFLNVKKTLTELTAEYFRKDHAQMSSSFIESNEFKNLNGINLIKPRIKGLLQNIVEAHQKDDFRYIIEELPYRCNGISKDVIHPRMIACLLRIGDLLDLDNGRFDDNMIKIFGNMPNLSRIHYFKHESISSLFVSPSLIEIEANCKNQDVYKELRSWIKWLEEEVKNISYNWFKIMPTTVAVIIPEVKSDRIFINNKIISTEYLNLALNFDTKKIYEILEGAGIYRNEFIFIRELLQNSIDATKIKLWKDLKVNFFEEDIDKIKKSPLNKKLGGYWEKYPIKIDIYSEFNNNEFDGVVIEIQDNGIGINSYDIKKISKIATNHKEDVETNLVKELPFYLKPTKAFGLGLQSCFLVANEIIIETKTYNDEGKIIKMNSGKKNGFISVEDIIKKSCGTTVKIKIPKDRLFEILKRENDKNVVEPEIYYTSMVFDKVHYEIYGEPYFEKSNKSDYRKQKENIWNTFSFPIEICCKNISESNKKIKPEIIESSSEEISNLCYEAYIGENKIEILDKINNRFILLAMNETEKINETEVFYKNIAILKNFLVSEFSISSLFYKLDCFFLKMNILDEDTKNFLSIDRENILDKNYEKEKTKYKKFKESIFISLIEDLCDIKDNDFEIEGSVEIKDYGNKKMNDFEFALTYNYHLIKENNKKLCYLKERYKELLVSNKVKSNIYYNGNILNKEIVFCINQLNKNIELNNNYSWSDMCEEIVGREKNVVSVNNKYMTYFDNIYKNSFERKYDAKTHIFSYTVIDEKRPESKIYNDLIEIIKDSLSIEKNVNQIGGIRRIWTFLEDGNKAEEACKLIFNRKFASPFYFLANNKRNDEKIYEEIVSIEDDTLKLEKIRENYKVYLDEVMIDEIETNSNLSKEEIIEEYAKFIKDVYNYENEMMSEK